jgi:hypothetical protein
MKLLPFSRGYFKCMLIGSLTLPNMIWFFELPKRFQCSLTGLAMIMACTGLYFALLVYYNVIDDTDILIFRKMKPGILYEKNKKTYDRAAVK